MLHQTTPHEHLAGLVLRFKRHECRCRAASYLGYTFSSFNLVIAIMTQDLWTQAIFAIMSLVLFLLAGSFLRLARKAQAFAEMSAFTLRSITTRNTQL